MNKLLWSIGHIVKQRTNMRGYPVPTPNQKLNGDTLNLFLWNFKTIISSNPLIFFFASQNISIDRATSRSIIFPNLRSIGFSLSPNTQCVIVHSTHVMVHFVKFRLKKTWNTRCINNQNKGPLWENVWGWNSTFSTLLEILLPPQPTSEDSF